jgi:hypothetical protein
LRTGDVLGQAAGEPAPSGLAMFRGPTGLAPSREGDRAPRDEAAGQAASAGCRDLREQESPGAALASALCWERCHPGGAEAGWKPALPAKNGTLRLSPVSRSHELQELLHAREASAWWAEKKRPARRAAGPHQTTKKRPPRIEGCPSLDRVGFNCQRTAAMFRGPNRPRSIPRERIEHRGRAGKETAGILKILES